jgi:hypothetical protein
MSHFIRPLKFLSSLESGRIKQGKFAVESGGALINIQQLLFIVSFGNKFTIPCCFQVNWPVLIYFDGRNVRLMIILPTYVKRPREPKR